MNKEQELKNLIKEIYDYWNKHNNDGHHKFQEGAITISQFFSNYFEEQKESWFIEVYSYIFCDGRRFEYEGNSRDEVIEKAIDYFKMKFQEYKNDALNNEDEL